MLLISQMTKPTSTHRWLAVVAMVVFVAGKSLHIHQESCCGNDATTAADVETSCPFGCQHHELSSTQADDDGQPDHAPTHDEQQCSVCLVLAAATECPFVLQLPECDSLIQPTASRSVRLPDLLEARLVRLRGPPIALWNA